MINSVSIENIKSHTKTVELTGLDALIGPMGAGKSALVKGIELAVSGNPSGFSKKNEDIFNGLATSNRMSSNIKCDDGFKCGRSLEQNVKGGKTSYKSDATVEPLFGEKNATQRGKRIDEYFGQNAIVADFEKFMNMTDTNKTSTVFELCGEVKSWTLNTVIEKVYEAAGDCEPDSFMDTTVKDIVQGIRMCPDVQTAVDAINNTINGLYSKYNALQDDAKATVKTLNKMKNEADTNVNGLKIAKKQLEKSQEEIESISSDIATAKSNNETLADKKSQLETLQSKLKKLHEDSLPDINQHKNRMKDIQNSIEIATTSYEQKTISLENSIEKKQVEIESRKKSIDDLKLKYKERKRNADLIEANIASFKEKMVKDSDVEKLESTIQFKKSTIENIEKSNGMCPLVQTMKCNCDFANVLKSYKEEIDKLEKEKSDLYFKQEIQSETYAELIKDHADAVEECELIVNEGNQIKSKIESLELEINQHKKDLKSEKERFVERIESAESRKESVQNLIDSHSDLLEKRKNEIADYEREIKDLKNFVSGKVHIEIEQMQTQLKAAKQKVIEYQSVIEEKTKAKQKLEDLTNAAITAEQHIEKFNVIKDLKNAFGSKGIKGEYVKASVEPLINGINENLEAMGRDETFYFEFENANGKPIFDFGWDRSGTRISYSSLSTGEKLICVIAFIAELIQGACKKKILLMDDVNHVNISNIETVLMGLTELRHKFDNVVLAFNAESKFFEDGTIKPYGFNIIKM